jgi:hypothetical protein
MGAISAPVRRLLYEAGLCAPGRSLRTRAGTLVAVANVATAFLGGLALADRGSVNGGAADLAAVEWFAIGFFCAAFAISLGILMPSRNWVFWHHPHSLLGVYVDPGPPTTLSEFRRSIAFYNGEHYDTNGRRLRVIAVMLWIASLFLAAEVVLWLWSLAT